MKHLKYADEEKVYRFHPVRTIIACVLIVAVFLSLSIGLGYSKYIYQTTPLKPSYRIKTNIYNYPRFVVKQRVPGQDTVLVTEDGMVKVTVPASSYGQNLTNAEYLILQVVPVASSNYARTNYSSSSLQNRYNYDISLHSMTFASGAVAVPYVVDSTAGITLEFNIGKDAVIDGHMSPTTAVLPNQAYDEDAGVYRYSGLRGLIPAINTSSFGGYFDRKTWEDYADVTWYNDQSTDFIINTPEQLAGVAVLVNNGTDSFEGKTIHLSGDVSLYSDIKQLGSDKPDKRAWQPIGTYANPFKGSFNGNNHTISGLNIRTFSDADDEKERTSGIFGMVKGDGSSVIKDVNITDVHYSAAMNVYEYHDSGQSFGALAGRCEDCSVSDVHVDGLVVSGTSKYIGGIVGRGISTGTIENCSVVDAVFAPNNSNNIGGIVGIHYSDGATVNLKNCYVSAEIGGGYESAGGIVGFGNNGAVGLENCYFTGQFNPTSSDPHSGSIVGFAFSGVNTDYTINNCYGDADADLFSYGYFGYKVHEGSRTIEEERTLHGNNIVIVNSSWSGDNDSFDWYSYAYDAGYTDYMGSASKSDSCRFTSGMSYDDFLAAIGSITESATTATEAPTVTPTEAPTEVQTDAPTETQTQVPSENTP